MALDELELRVGQAAGLVEHLIGHLHLAEVVEQTADATLAQVFAGQPEGAPEGDHQGAHAHRVQEGVVVLVLDADEAQQRAAVAQHRAGDRLHHRLGVLEGHRLAEAHIPHHRTHDLVGLLVDLPGAVHLLAHRHTHHRLFRLAHRGDDLPLDLGLDLLGRHRVHVVQPAIGVDVHMLDAGFDDAAQIGLAVQLEPGPPERVGHPVTTEFIDEHTRPKPGHGDLLEHLGGPARKFRIVDLHNGSRVPDLISRVTTGM